MAAFPALIDSLRQLTADIAVIVQNFQLAHWLTRGSTFFELHEFYGEAYGAWGSHYDKMAEALMAHNIDSVPIARPSQIAEMARIDEMNDMTDDVGIAQSILNMIEEYKGYLADDIEIVERAGERGIVNMFDDFAEVIDNQRFLLKAFLKRSN